MEALPDFSAQRFLVVDDVAEMVETVTEMLRRCGARHIYRASGSAPALAVLSREKDIDCVISDFNMSPENGLQLLAAIRTGSQPRTPRDRRFILLTGHGEMEVVRAAQALDVHGYVVKPVSLVTLIQTVQRALARSIKLKTVSEYQAIKIVGAPI